MGVFDSCVSAAVWEEMSGSLLYDFPRSYIPSSVIRAPVLTSCLSYLILVLKTFLFHL